MLNPYLKPDQQQERSSQQMALASVQEFNQARRRATWRRLLGGLAPRRARVAARLKELDQASTGPSALPRRELGLQTVPLAAITGSLGRSRDFDRDFAPLSDRARERWSNLHDLYHRGSLPPVKLYQLCGEYYVVDGHHRLSVGRSHGLLEIEAEVTRLEAPSCSVDF